MRVPPQDKVLAVVALPLARGQTSVRLLALLVLLSKKAGGDDESLGVRAVQPEPPSGLVYYSATMDPGTADARAAMNAAKLARCSSASMQRSRRAA